MIGRRLWRAAALALLAALTAGACAAATPRDHAAVVLRIEKVRAHLLAAAENAERGAWSEAAAHAAHPAEDMQPIDAALAKRDPKADAALRAQLIAVRDAVAARSVGTAIADADALLAAAAATITGGIVDEWRFRASVASALLEMVATEYEEAVVDGRIVNEIEYQDAYAFLTRTRALVLDDPDGVMPPESHAACEALAGTMRGITPPTKPASAEHVRGLAAQARAVLLAAAGSEYATAATSDLGPLVAELDAAAAALDTGDGARAAEALATFRGTWTQVEGGVKARSADAYGRIERDLAIATAAIGADTPAAREAIARMRADIAPLAGSEASYGVFDAALILLREGMEALLVVAALLAFLSKTGNADKRRWIWAGGGAGIVASLGIAAAITLAFSASASAGADREVLEGITGVFAAAMLVYMSWWLHSRSSLGAWDRYIRAKSGAALARNSLLGLSAIAFLAVFREGAETALFYLGMAPSIALWELVAGVGIATLALVVVGVLVLAFGVRIPVRPFFLATSVLVYYLAFKFLGTGIHALQVAGALPATPRPYLPDIDLIGAFPTVETTAMQGMLLAAALLWLAVRELRRPGEVRERR